MIKRYGPQGVNKRYSPENMGDKKVRTPRSQDDNNKRWFPENMDEKKRMGHWGLDDNKKRDDTLKIWQCCGFGMFIRTPGSKFCLSRIKKIHPPTQWNLRGGR
jgi:hypothetical protein